MVVRAYPPTIFSRPARHIARATCPECKVPNVGVTFHGTLLSGQAVYQVAAHSPGRRAVKNSEPRCKGSDQRMQVTDDGWRAA